MARPIAPTPKLNRKSTEAFVRQVGTDLKRPVGLVKTPKLSAVVKMIRDNARSNEK